MGYICACRIGGGGGTWFDDTEKAQGVGKQITAIRMHGGLFVDSIEVVYGQVSAGMHGGNGGGDSGWFKMEDGESKLSCFSGCWSLYSVAIIPIETEVCWSVWAKISIFYSPLLVVSASLGPVG